MSGRPALDVSLSDYQSLSDFRFQIRRFLHFSESASRVHGLEPQQHQLLLTLKGLRDNQRPTISFLAERLLLKHHSAVELLDRLVEKGAVVRRHSPEDRREVLIEITPAGEHMLQTLSELVWQELAISGPELARSLAAVLRRSEPPKANIDRTGPIQRNFDNRSR